MDLKNIKDKINETNTETDTFLKLVELLKAQDDFIEQSLHFLNDLHKNADNLSFKEEYNKQAQKQFISEIDRIKESLCYNRFVDLDFKLKMSILLVELPPKQRELFFLIGIKEYNNLTQIGNIMGCKTPTISEYLRRMFEFFSYGNEKKCNIATKTIFKNFDKSYRHKEVEEIQTLCMNAPKNAEIIINNLFNELATLDKNKQAKKHYIDHLYKMYSKREKKDIQS